MQEGDTIILMDACPKCGDTSHPRMGMKDRETGNTKWTCPVCYHNFVTNERKQWEEYFKRMDEKHRKRL